MKDSNPKKRGRPRKVQKNVGFEAIQEAAIEDSGMDKEKLKAMAIYERASLKERTHYHIIRAIGELMEDRTKKSLPSIPEIMHKTGLSRRCISDHLAVLRKETSKNLKGTVRKLLVPHIELICKRVITMSAYNPSSQKLFFDLLGYGLEDSTTEDKDTNINIVINKKKDDDQAESKDNKVIDV